MKNSVKLFNQILLSLIMGLLVNTNYAQTDSTKAKKLFLSDELIEMNLEMDIKKVIRDIGEEREYHPAFLSYKENGKTISLEVKVRTRGNYRRQKMICKFPPLRIKFPLPATENTVFAGHKKLKLVTYCNNGNQFEKNILNEYLIYKMLNELTDKSYKVRLVKIKYVDIKNKIKTIERFSFFIEKSSDVARRMGGKIINAKNAHPEETNRKHITLITIFQYMIGNTDFSVSGLHNIKLVSVDPWKPPFTIAYDFDWAGFVNASYAKPNPVLNTENIRERLYRGYPRTMEELKATFAIFEQSKQSIMNLLSTFPYLNEKDKKKNIKYINQFYRIISKDKLIKREIIRNFRKPSN